MKNPELFNGTGFMDDLLEALLEIFVVIVSVPFLAFISMFAHEGGHGLFIVPAIIINGEIPEIPSTGSTENPFHNFPLGILSLFLSFPLGVMANALLLILAYRNAKLYRITTSKYDLALFTVFLSFSILNFGAILTNFFGPDFSFIIKDFLGFPSDEEWFRIGLRLITFTAFPGILVIKVSFDLRKVLIITTSTYLVNYITVELIANPLTSILLRNFWWLFIFGLPVLISVTIILLRSYAIKAKLLSMEATSI